MIDRRFDIKCKNEILLYWNKACFLCEKSEWIEKIETLRIWIKNEALRIANEYIDSISSKYKVRQAFLYGSFAKWNYREDSDIDIAIVVNDVDDIIDTHIDLMKLRRKTISELSRILL